MSITKQQTVGTELVYGYGITATIQNYERCGGSWLRYDLTSVPASEYERARDVIEYMFVVDRSDATPAHSTYPTGYDSRCGACYLNNTHSEAYHQRNIAAAEQKAGK